MPDGEYRQFWRVGEPTERGQLVVMTMSSFSVESPEWAEVGQRTEEDLLKWHNAESVSLMRETHVSAAYLDACLDAEDERDGN